MRGEIFYCNPDERGDMNNICVVLNEDVNADDYEVCILSQDHNKDWTYYIQDGECGAPLESDDGQLIEPDENACFDALGAAVHDALKIVRKHAAAWAWQAGIVRLERLARYEFDAVRLG